MIGRDFHDDGSWFPRQQVEIFMMTCQDFQHDFRSRISVRGKHLNIWLRLATSRQCSHMSFYETSMIEWFAVRHLCSGFLFGKMAVWMNEQTDGLFYFWVVHWLCQSFVIAKKVALRRSIAAFHTEGPGNQSIYLSGRKNFSYNICYENKDRKHSKIAKSQEKDRPWTDITEQYASKEECIK